VPKVTRPTSACSGNKVYAREGVEERGTGRLAAERRVRERRRGCCGGIRDSSEVSWVARLAARRRRWRPKEVGWALLGSRVLYLAGEKTRSGFGM
jgi:hypothetical protein